MKIFNIWIYLLMRLFVFLTLGLFWVCGQVICVSESQHKLLDAFSRSSSCSAQSHPLTPGQPRGVFVFTVVWCFPSVQRKPLVLEGLDLGPCTSKWTVDYLSRAGGTKEVKVHVAAVAQMDFISKNFVYRYFLLRLLRGPFLKPLKIFLHHYVRPFCISSLIQFM